MNAATLLNVILLIGGSAFIIGQWRNGGNKKNSDAVINANNTIDLLNKRIVVLEGNSKEQHDDIIRMQEQIKHKDMLIQQYEAIFKNRNPEMEIFMKNMTDSVQGFQDYIKIHTKQMEDLLKVIQLMAEGPEKQNK